MWQLTDNDRQVAENGVMEDLLLRIIPLIGAESLFEE